MFRLGVWLHRQERAADAGPLGRCDGGDSEKTGNQGGGSHEAVGLHPPCRLQGEQEARSRSTAPVEHDACLVEMADYSSRTGLGPDKLCRLATIERRCGTTACREIDTTSLPALCCARVLQVGEIIGGRFRTDRLIGIGGFGVVAAATHLELRQSVAIKMMKDEFVGDTEIIERFLREARAVAVLRTDHVCRVLDVARTEQGTPYIVMDLLEGSDVASMLRTEPLPVATAVDFVVQACVALAEAHPRGIVHRDLKPPNLFVTRRPDGSPLVKLLDFGVAKAADELRLTHSMAMLGSPQYMSPEQLTTPRDVDARTDIWSLGVTLYQMISGRLPFPSAQIGELAVMITTQPPSPIDVAPGLRAVLMCCLEKERAARFGDVAALAAALAPFGGPTTQAYAALVCSTATVGSPMATSSPAAPKRRRALLLAPLAVLLIGGALLASFFLVRGSSTDDTSKTVETKPAASAVAPAVTPQPSAPAPSPYVKALMDTEQQIKDHADDPALLQRLYSGAGMMACALKDVSKAGTYLAKLTDAEMQKEVRETCAAYGIGL